jgi:hypothetical protein
MTYYINVYQMGPGGRQFLGKAVDSKSLSDEMAYCGHAIYRLRVKPKAAA